MANKREAWIHIDLKSVERKKRIQKEVDELGYTMTSYINLLLDGKITRNNKKVIPNVPKK